MGLSAEEELGYLIGDISSEQNNIKENVLPDESLNVFLLAPFETAAVFTYYGASAQYYGTSTFVIDHPVYGDIDSSILHIDGGYASTSVLYSSIEV